MGMVHRNEFVEQFPEMEVFCLGATVTEVTDRQPDISPSVATPAPQAQQHTQVSGLVIVVT
jgi:hypothetical protein